MLRYSLHRQFIENWQNLSDDERASVQRLLEMLHESQITPGMRPHRVGPFLSLSPNMDLRIIALSHGDGIILLHVGHHDAAYLWAMQKKLLDTEVGSTELVNLNAWISSQNLAIPSDSELPIPIQDILSIQDEDLFLKTIVDMSPEWQEWLFNAYTIGETSQPPTGSSLIYSPTDDVKLMEAINLNIPAWQIFLHPTQQEAVDDLSSKSIAITGGPGTGKTIVLLNRILSHAPKGKDKDCSVILTYSASLAGYIYDRLKFTSSRYFHVFPLYFLGGKLPDHIPDETAFKKFKLVIENGKLVLQYKGSESRPVRELLVDEFQDAPSEVARTLEMLIASGFTRVTIAADLDQSIFRVNKQDIVVPMQLCEKHYELTYCYRSTRQIINKATEWLTTFNLETSSKVVYALSGPRVRLVSCKDLSHQVEETEKVFSDLQKRYSHDSLALIYCQYFNPSFKGKSIEEDILKSHSVLSKYYHFASTTKGQEFFAGALFISNTFLSKHLGTNADRLRINTLYVALTRFRDEVTVVYPEGCAIESMLQKLDNLE